MTPPTNRLLHVGQAGLFGADKELLSDKSEWTVFVGGVWHGRVYPRAHYLVEFGIYGLNYRQIGPTQKASFGRVRILSMDGVDACSQVWLRSDGPGEGLVVVLDGGDS